MRKISCTFIAVGLFATYTFPRITPSLINGSRQEQSPDISFTENKGQVHDQNYKSCPDILYGVMVNNMAVHIKKSGVSYQLYRVDKWREAEDLNLDLIRHPYPEAGSKKEIDQQTIYRIDLSWLNHNKCFTKTEDETLPGFDNYYLESCPNGALYVKSYKGITLHNLYEGINLHYYEINGELKHDYIVAPHADYKQIQLKVEGADINVNDDGSLILSTPLGKIQEGAPIVYQNGRQLKAKWQIKHNVLSFEVENYNLDYELIIDPVTRIWGTYYGGAGIEYGNSCATDAAGNVYLAGFTDSSTGGTLIATTGGHQSILGGNLDAFLAKFNSSGVRQWGTFYGGSDGDVAISCATDIYGNVYLAGNTFNFSSAIATPASHQPVFGGGSSDAFLVKFNANGVRQWGTYYGDSGQEVGNCCVTDTSGNVYLSGATYSNFGIGTAGTHQSLYAGMGDAYLVKFNASGTRLWGTYYGSSSPENGTGCAVDPGGNVYLAGETIASSSVISTPGSHQTMPGGGRDAFLVKFNSTGIRLWGTYYGGTAADFGGSCTTDGSGNVYLTGETASNTGTAIASPGSHQLTNGGYNDAFLVKFNSNGIRQWGTYYGGTADEIGSSCTTFAAGNVYLVGATLSAAGTVIATPGGHQPIYGGGAADAFLVEFDANGVRQEGTYYGGSGHEYGLGCASDAYGSIYVSGRTTSGTGTVIATTGGHQPAFGGGGLYDAFLVKIDRCNAAPAQPSALNGPTAVCVGALTFYSTLQVLGATSYTLWLPGGGSFSGITNTIVTIPVSSGVFTLAAGNPCGASPGQTLQVTVNPLPTIAAGSGTICSGESFTIIASGASTYTYSGGGPVVSPTITTSYTVTGVDGNSCASTTTVTQFVEICTEVDPQEVSYTSGVSVYPNPNSGIFTIRSDLNINLTIVNTLGQIVGALWLKDQNGREITVGNLMEGIYFVTGQAGGLKVNKKIVVMK